MDVEDSINITEVWRDIWCTSVVWNRSSDVVFAVVDSGKKLPGKRMSSLYTKW